MPTGTLDECTVCGGSKGLELVVSSQSLPEVGRLAANEQVVFIHDFFFGETAVLTEEEEQPFIFLNNQKLKKSN